MTLRLSEVSKKVFMRCLFDKDTTGIDNWDELYTLYIDMSGLGEDGQLGLYVAIHNLDCRLKDITSFLEFQSKVYHLINMPHIPRMDELHKYGHRLVWDPNNDNFLDQLNSIEAKEKRNYVEMKKLNKELKQMKEAQKPNTISARNCFVIMMNTLGKEGYQIDNDTDMESISLMIKQHGDDVKASQNQQ